MDAYSAHDTTGITQELAGREGVVRRKWGSLQGEGGSVFCYLLSDEAADQEAGIINPELGEQPCQRLTRDA